MSLIVLDEAVHGGQVESAGPAKAEAPDVVTDRLGQRAFPSGGAEMQPVPLAGEEIHQIDGHLLGSTDSERVDHVHYADRRHAPPSRAGRSLGSVGPNSRTCQCSARRAARASRRPSSE